MSKTSIEWCDHSINPIRARDRKTGAVGHYCEKIAAGCTNCYSSALQRRFKMPTFGSGQHRDSVEIFLDESKLTEVRKRRKPTRYFWCDMTDIFGDWMKPEWLSACFQAMDATPQHTHILLTKRPENIRKMWPPQWGDNDLPVMDKGLETMEKYRPNCWLLTSVSDQPTADRNIPELLKCRELSPVLGVSYEPALGPVDFTRYINGICFAHDKDFGGTGPCEGHGVNDPWLACLDWIICGGESGPKARHCNVKWFRDAIEQCQPTEHDYDGTALGGVACFVKQLGAKPMTLVHPFGPCSLELRDSKGGDIDEFPEDLQVREFPNVA